MVASESGRVEQTFVPNSINDSSVQRHLQELGQSLHVPTHANTHQGNQEMAAPIPVHIGHFPDLQSAEAHIAMLEASGDDLPEHLTFTFEGKFEGPDCKRQRVDSSKGCLHDDFLFKTDGVRHQLWPRL